jgi:hypothetical protein
MKFKARGGWGRPYDERQVAEEADAAFEEEEEANEGEGQVSKQFSSLYSLLFKHPSSPRQTGFQCRFDREMEFGWAGDRIHCFSHKRYLVTDKNCSERRQFFLRERQELL